MDTFTLVRSRLEKQDTWFREAFPIEKESSNCLQEQPPEVFYEKKCS